MAGFVVDMALLAEHMLHLLLVRPSPERYLSALKSFLTAACLIMTRSLCPAVVGCVKSIAKYAFRGARESSRSPVDLLWEGRDGGEMTPTMTNAVIRRSYSALQVQKRQLLNVPVVKG